MSFKSKEELYTSWWLDELLEAGYVNEYWYEDNRIKLSDPLEIEIEKQLKTKTKIVKKNLLQGHSYTPDFTVDICKSLKNKLYAIYDTLMPNECILYTESFNPYVMLEVKPSYNQNNMTREFRINQKWLAEKGIFVNLFQPEKIFKQTFTPERYYLTDSGRQQRKRKWEYRTLEEWMEELNEKSM